MRLAQQPISDALYAQVHAAFTVEETRFLTAAIGAINAWNRSLARFGLATAVTSTARRQKRTALTSRLGNVKMAAE